MTKQDETVKEHVVLDSCAHLGNIKINVCEYKGVGSGTYFEMASYCTKQQECLDEIHKNLKCKECPDFKAYEYTAVTTYSGCGELK